MSDLKKAFPKVKWKWKSKDDDENVVVGHCANGLSIEVYRPLGGYVETYASVFLDGELLFDEWEPLDDGKPIDDDISYEINYDDPPPDKTDPASQVIRFAVGCALFSRVVGKGISLQSLTSFDPWIQECLVGEIERRQGWAQGRLQEAEKIVAQLEPYFGKAGEALAILNKHAVDCPVKHKNSTRETT